MSLSFDNAATEYVSMSAGGVGAMGTGAHTLVMLAQSSSAAFSNRFQVGLYAGGTLLRSLLNVDGVLFAHNDFGSGFGTLAEDTWYVVAVSKPAGSGQSYRYHLWPYASDGSGTMSHGTDGATQGDGSAITEIRIGGAELPQFGGNVAVVGLWASVLSDAQLNTLKSASLSSWSALSPQALITGNNWNGTTGCTDVIGTSTQQSITGTVGVGTEPPSFSYSLASSILPIGWFTM